MRITPAFFCALALVLCLMLQTRHAAAERVNSLTEDNIRRFVSRTTDVTSRNTSSMSDEDVRAYLDNHLHKKGFFRSEVRYQIPGFPNQESALSLNKEQFIESVLGGQEALENYETKVSVNNIRISDDGRKATLSTNSEESGLMPMPGDTGSGARKIPVQGSSRCKQILMLEERTIQMYSANCKTHIKFEMSF